MVTKTSMSAWIANSHSRRVALIGPVNTRGGVQSCMFALIRGLNQQGIVPDILWEWAPDPALLQEEGAQAGYCPLRFRIPVRQIDRLPLSAAYLLRAANVLEVETDRLSYDFYYVFYNGFRIPPGVPHVRYLSGPPLIPQLETISPGVRGVPFRLVLWLYRRWVRRIAPVYEYQAHNDYVVNSHYIAGLFEEAHGVRLPVVHPPIDFRDRYFTPGDLANRDTITFFSRVVSYKRPEMVIELAGRYRDLRCVIMGSVTPDRAAYFDSLKALARARGRPDIEFLPTPSGQRVRAELARTRFFVFPGANEHFGMATPEAIASGAVPFVHDSGGQREIVPDPRLRFTDETFFDRFEDLLRLSDAELNDLRDRLSAHIQQYAEEVYVEKMLSLAGLRSAGEPQTAVAPRWEKGEVTR